MTTATAATPPPYESVTIWGVPFAPWTLAETVAGVERLIAARTPSYFITANLHYMMLTAQHPALAEVNRRAAFITADGKPAVIASRWHGRRLPERVTGADLVPELCRISAERGYRIFLLGGEPGVADRAADVLRQRHPAIPIVGTESPPFRPLSPEELEALFARIRAANPDLLFVSFGQPKGELWLHEHLEKLGVPVSAQVGATLDFIAGRVSRAPLWVQKLSLEWLYRLGTEPRRLTGRYLANGWFALKMLARDLFGRR